MNTQYRILLKNQPQYAETETKLNEKAEEDGYEIAGFLAYDIFFQDSEGNKIEPVDGSVNVSMHYTEPSVPEEVAQVTENGSEVDVFAEEDEFSQNETTATTAESFRMIEKDSEMVASKAKELSGAVGELNEANKKIVDSISTISAISEEVAAHANDTLEESENNITVVEALIKVADELNGLANKLDNIEV